MDREVKEFIVQRALSADEQFIEDVKESTFLHIDSLLATKGDEYSQKVNRLENFLDGAAMDKQTPEEALWGMLKKHILSIKKFIREVSTGKRYDPVKWAEKTDDIITYMILLKVMNIKRFEVETLISRKETEEILKQEALQRDAEKADQLENEQIEAGEQE